MINVQKTYIAEREEGLFKIDVWENGGYKALAQQIQVEEYRTSYSDGSNITAAANSAIKKLIEKYNL